ETTLTDDGRDDFPYKRLYWSPDSATLVAFRFERGDHKEVYRLESSPSGPTGMSGGGVGRAVLHTSEYPLPGDKLDSYELNVFNIAAKKQFKPLGDQRIDMSADGADPNPYFGNGQYDTMRWRQGSAHFFLEKYDRGHQRLRLIDVDCNSGEARNIIDEKSKTFIWTAHFEGLNLRLFNYLSDESEMIYASEMDGWRHLYHIDTATGSFKQITHGSWVVRGINRIDQDARQIWFTASGVLPDQDPYFIQYGRVNFDGTGLTWLTSANGNHSINFGRFGNAGSRGGFGAPAAAQIPGSFSPDFKYVIDTYSRVDLPPITELRRATDGQFVCLLEKADVTADWTAPEVFVAKGRDDTTDIWGLIIRPKNFDPAKKYAVIEDIYAGPQDSFVPKKFNTAPRYQDLTDLGFIVVKIDGMGTANRSKAFHDVCFKNLKDAGFLDRIAWIKAAAKKYPYMDLDRVGIYGTSAGGQNAAAAVLFHPEFYKVAVANSGCHDNRMDKITWNEQWMGYPVGPQYAECSNINNAFRLQGRLQLVVGELDINVPPESTYRFVDALVKTKKDFEFVLIPGADHGARSSITQTKLHDFFVRYLQNTEPPNHNASAAASP
ncbi:MAG TPA: prolyl oligopeptidase family serine peptidase, partial [Pirellulales bacterium]